MLIDEEDRIIAGHGRVLAAELLEIDTAPVIVAKGWSAASKRAYTLADNKLTLTSEWDLEMLTGELGALAALDFDIELTGFSELEAQALYSAFNPETSEEVGAPTNEWRGMPEFDHVDQTAYRRIVMHFKDEADIEEFARRIDQKIGPKTRSMWFPPDDIGVIKDKRYGKGEQ